MLQVRLWSCTRCLLRLSWWFNGAAQLVRGLACGVLRCDLFLARFEGLAVGRVCVLYVCMKDVPVLLYIILA